MPDHRLRHGGLHRVRVPWYVRAGQWGFAVAVLLAGAGTMLVVGQSDPGPAVPVQGSFAAAGDPYVIPTPTTAGPPTTGALLEEPADTAVDTSRRSSDRVVSAKTRGVTPTSAPKTSSRERAATATTAPSKSAPRTASTVPPSSTAGASSCSSDGIKGGTVKWVGQAANWIADRTGHSGDMLGIANRAGNPDSDHPHGYAVDFMVDSKAEGDRVASFAREHADELNVTYVLWRVPDHFDHVHVSFSRKVPDTATFRC